MGRFQQSNDARPLLATIAIYITAGLSIGSVFLILRLDPIEKWASVMAIASPLIFLCASVLVFFRRSLGFILGAIAGAVALPFFVLTQSSWHGPSTWTLLNGPDVFGQHFKRYATLIIFSVAIIAAAVTLSFLRLLPSRLILRNTSLSRRTWPAIPRDERQLDEERKISDQPERPKTVSV